MKKHPDLGTLLVLLALVAGCDAPRDVRSSGEPAPAETQAPRAVKPGARAVEEMRVVWPARSSADAGVLARVPADARVAIDGAAVPVLVPKTAGLAERARAVSKPAFFALSIQGEGEHAGLSIAISATKIVHRHPGIDRAAPTHTVRSGKPAWILQNEGIWSAAWEENGVSYVVDLECARPSEDARCASVDQLVAIVDDLVFVGGSFAGGAR